MKIFESPIEFEWDRGNKDKNFFKHQVTTQEAEEVFFDPHKRILKDSVYQKDEDRYLVIGVTKKDRLLFVVFTVRKSKIRIISARSLNKKERGLYEN